MRTEETADENEQRKMGNGENGEVEKTPGKNGRKKAIFSNVRRGK